MKVKDIEFNEIFNVKLSKIASFKCWHNRHYIIMDDLQALEVSEEDYNKVLKLYKRYYE